eukprot:825147_1
MDGGDCGHYNCGLESGFGYGYGGTEIWDILFGVGIGFNLFECMKALAGSHYIAANAFCIQPVGNRPISYWRRKIEQGSIDESVRLIMNSEDRGDYDHYITTVVWKRDLGR